MATDLAIIGGGAAGMAAGILAARAGLSVLILEKNERFGKKLRATGNGRCNFTNARQSPDCYRSSDPSSAWAIVQAFPVSWTLSFFRELGIEPVDRDGYYYPASGQAADMVAVLLDELSRLHAKCKTNQRVTGMAGGKGAFCVQTEGYAYEAGRVLLCAGGMAAPVHGTDGDGFALAEAAGHCLIAPVPALAALRSDAPFLNGLAGVRAGGRIRVYEGALGDVALAQDCGELQFTAGTVSGIPAMQVSRFAARSLAAGRQVTAVLDFLPELSEDEARRVVHSRRERLCRKRMAEWFTGWFPEKLAAALLKEAGIRRDTLAAEVTEAEWGRLAGLLKHTALPVRQVRPFTEAQATSGGVALAECTPYLESCKLPGLYFAGEVLDVDGACGGYNLHWAWASAARAVQGMLLERGEMRC